MITHKQMNCLKAIASYQRQHGYAPSREELRHTLYLTNKSTVQRIIEGLLYRGFIVTIPYRARAMEITGKGRAILSGRCDYFRFDPETQTLQPMEVSR